ncbi:MAG: molybdopterin cofactor-binding domain-containing protein [Duganella sp.]
MNDLSLPRRNFLQAGAMALAVSASGRLWAQDQAAKREPKYGADTMPGGVVDQPLVFVSIAADGVVTIIAHRIEMGTGIRTSLPMVVADEMQADWTRVRIEQAEANEAKYGSQNVDGSRSIRHFLAPMRRVGAAMRQMLEAAAAAQWSVPLAEVRAVRHEVLHTPSGRRLGYGPLAASAMRQQVPAEPRLKDPKDFLYIGKGKVLAYDNHDIVSGQATYGIDVRLPGMLYAVIARPPVLGSTVAAFDAADALKVAGVLKVVKLESYPGAPLFHPLGGVAVIARNTWAALQGRAALKIEWTDSPHAGYASAAYRQSLSAAVRQPTGGKAARNDGNVYAALQAGDATRRVSAEYYLPHLAHVSMEAPAATALFKDGRCEVWAPVQAPQGTLENVAQHLGLKPEQVSVRMTLLGGGFGRKSKPDFAVEAALLAQQFPGQPVKVTWSREDDIRHDYLHTVSVERLESVLDAQGMPQAWLHRSAAPTITSTFVAGAKAVAPFEVGMSASNVPFRIPHVRVETAEVTAHARIGWFRSVSNIPHAFAVQSFVAELAHKAGRDHRDYLLDLLGPARKIDPAALGDNWNYSESPQLYPVDIGRMRGVVERATREAGWGRKLPARRGLGLALAYSFLSYVAVVLEVYVTPAGEVRVEKVDMAIDCGPQVNPERIRSQAEGGCIMGLSLALMGEISFKDGQTEQSNFHDFPVLRLNESPKQIRVHLVGNDFAVAPGGVGEPVVPPVAPALVNAIFAATGKRVRDLPVRDQLKA